MMSTSSIYGMFGMYDIRNLDEETLTLASESDFWSVAIQPPGERIELANPGAGTGTGTVLPEHSLLEQIDENNILWNELLDPDEQLKLENIIRTDCMWSGDYEIDEADTFISCDPIAMSPTPGQSLLRREMSPSRPDTPPSVDGDEPPQFLHTVDVAGTARRLLRNSAVVAADHSYTLSQRSIDNLGVQTPSDSGESEEEIDVVSVGTQLPLSPMETTHIYTESQPSRSSSVSERRHIQQCVATLTNPRSRPIARKRLVPPPSVASTLRQRPRGPGRRGRRSHTDSESEAESPEIERRSIHNDMERLRRIGLKNLFDELKKQIPATRDKERAPKVVILREAAALCRKLSQEEVEREKLRKKQNQLITKLKKLRTRIFRTNGGALRTPY